MYEDTRRSTNMETISQRVNESEKDPAATYSTSFQSEQEPQEKTHEDYLEELRLAIEEDIPCLSDAVKPFQETKLFVYGETSGMVFVGQEIGQKYGKIIMKYPAYVAMNERQTGYVFRPFSFVEDVVEVFPTRVFYRVPMPSIMYGSYMEYVKRMKST